MPGPFAALIHCAIRLALTAAAVPVWLAPAAVQSTEAGDPCDPKLARPAKDPLGYERRGERCEGLYVQEVAGTAGLLVASLTEPVESLDLASGGQLRVGWTTVGQAAVRLRGVALRRRLYYRMDAVRPAGSTAFDWPTDVLASLKMNSQELGLVGWIEQQIGSRTEEVYVPLRVGKGDVARTSRYVLQIVPGSELSELYVTLAEVGRDGRDVSAMKRDEPLKYGYYPAERAIRLSLPVLDRAGLYRVQLGGTLSRGGSVSKTLFLYHAGR